VTIPLGVLPQYLLPKLALTRLAGFVASAALGPLTTWTIQRFVARYQVNMAEALDENPSSYKTFNAFFTRALKPSARTLATSTWVSPVDGAISQCGAIDKDQIFQAKGHCYSIRALVGGDAALAAQFQDGQFATLYLSPRDYHRIHMPIAGKLKRMIHVPGDLFSVNPSTARGVPGLFARNERVVCEFETVQGPMVMVLVGATIVGSMATVWHGQVNPPRPGTVREWHYDTKDVQLGQGQEMGRFLLGSTVVMLMPQNSIQFPADWLTTRALQMGEVMGNLPS
jgi:phosphatidylserine decarboxylase